MASELQRVAQGLVDALSEIPGVIAHLHRTAARCRENAALVMQLAGNRGAMAAQQLDAAARACEAAAHHLSMAPPKALGWAQRLVGIAPDAGRRESRPSWNVSDEPAPFIEQIFNRLPDRPGGEGPTSGILTTPDGRKLVHVASGRSGPGADGAGLTGKTARLRVARVHAEGHAAAVMRRLQLREMTLYLNNQPCGWGSNDMPLGCDATLRYQIPPGSKLTVYWPGGHQIYIGEEGEPE